MNGTDLGPRSASCSASNGLNSQVPSSSCSPALGQVINGDVTPNSTPSHQPSDSDTESRTRECELYVKSIMAPFCESTGVSGVTNECMLLLFCIQMHAYLTFELFVHTARAFRLFYYTVSVAVS